MYIHSVFKQISEIQNSSIYKKQLKEISKINLRQSSKLNVIAVYGALKCLENISYDKNLSIYLASQYSCTQNMLNVITQVNTKDDFVMPFDFLNINTNNVGFFISEALGTIGKSLNVTSEDLSFEKAFELAYFDLMRFETKEALIGGVDESLENIINDYELINNLENHKTKDGTAWMFLSSKKEGALAKIKALEIYQNIENLNSHLESITYDKISLNQYAKQYKNDLKIDQNLIIKQQDQFYGTSAAGYLVDLLKYKKELIHISLDSKKRAYLFILEKIKSKK
ncbi:MAG: hypothetical protein ACI9TO_000443 [Rickettsiales bacterium]|jgi:hypothetical protein